jgi:hypothetical protein
LQTRDFRCGFLGRRKDRLVLVDWRMKDVALIWLRLRAILRYLSEFLLLIGQIYFWKIFEGRWLNWLLLLLLFRWLVEHFPDKSSLIYLVNITSPNLMKISTAEHRIDCGSIHWNRAWMIRTWAFRPFWAYSEIPGYILLNWGGHDLLLNSCCIFLSDLKWISALLSIVRAWSVYSNVDPAACIPTICLSCIAMSLAIYGRIKRIVHLLYSKWSLVLVTRTS